MKIAIQSLPELAATTLHWLELRHRLQLGKRRLVVRLDPGKGRGHHEYVRTAGVQSKFGISSDQFDRLADLVEKAEARVLEPATRV